MFWRVFLFFCGLLWIFSTWTNLFPSRINPRQSSVDLLWTFIRAKKNFWTFVEKKREKRTIVQIHYSHIIFKTLIRSKKLNIQQRKQSAVQAVHTCIDCWGSYFFCWRGSGTKLWLELLGTNLHNLQNIRHIAVKVC